MSQNGSSLPQIPQKSLSELLSEESKSHSPKLQFEIAMHYLEDVEKNPTKAFEMKNCSKRILRNQDLKCLSVQISPLPMKLWKKW